MRAQSKSLRLKLTDFLGTDIEEYVVYALCDIKALMNFTINITMWYSSSELDKKLLVAFTQNNKNLIDHYSINFYHLNGFEYPSWYDIISKKDEKLLSKFHIRSTYIVPDEIPIRLIEFKNFMKGYNTANEKHSSNRFNQLAGSSKTQEHSV